MQSFRESSFIEADFSGSHFRGVDFSDVKISDAWMVGVDISGHIDGLTINGVDVTAFVEQQLDERHPIRKLFGATDPEGMQRAWNALEHAASETLERARRLPASALDESVDDEWSYIQTLRHLIHATDRWISAPVLHEPVPFHVYGLPNPPYEDLAPGQFDVDARPSLEEVLTLRRDRMTKVRDFLATVTSEQLDREVASPNGGVTATRRCFQVIFKEEWWHDQYANRDLAIIEERSA